jgi:hypothetical protein
MLDTKEERIAYGEKYEERTIEYIKKSFPKLNVYSTKSLPNWSPKFDLENGDIVIESQRGTIKKIDVKVGSFVSYKSAERFKGDGFLFVSGDLSTPAGSAYYVPAASIKSYMRKVSKSGKLVQAPSGDFGHRFKPTLLYRAMKFSQWLTSL